MGVGRGDADVAVDEAVPGEPHTVDELRRPKLVISTNLRIINEYTTMDTFHKQSNELEGFELEPYPNTVGK